MSKAMAAKKQFVEKYVADCIRGADDHFTTFEYVNYGCDEYLLIGQRGTKQKIKICISADNFMSIIYDVVRKVKNAVI